MSKKPETEFKEKVRPLLEALPYTWVEKIQQVSIRGTPDFLCCVCGVFVAVELKTDEGELEPLQEHKLNKIAACGGISLVMTPSNLDETMTFLRGMSKELENYRTIRGYQ